jgi:hypothetical protein
MYSDKVLQRHKALWNIDFTFISLECFSFIPVMKPVTVKTRRGVFWEVTSQRLLTGYKSLGGACYVYTFYGKMQNVSSKKR